MIIKSLNLQNFRNTKKSQYDFSKNTTAIIGPNAVGKSNILEAIQLFATGKSAKADREEELVRFDQDSCFLKATISNEVAHELAITIVKNPFGRITKQYTVNGVKRRRVDFLGNFASILFSPEDLDLVVDSPSLRREYINTVLSQVSKDYRMRLSRYENAIKRRNRVLYLIREGQGRGSDLDIWDSIIVASGQKLTQERGEFFTAMNGLNESFPKIKWQYIPHEISQEKLDINRGRDIDAAQTLSGPHRDDFDFYEGKRNLASFGSRGEQRLAVLALKLAELSFISSKLGDRPVLLLDDIFSELDEAHRETVMNLLGKQQTILTSTEEEYIHPKQHKDIQVIRL